MSVPRKKALVRPILFAAKLKEENTKLPREELLTTDKARGATGHQPGKKHPPRFLFFDVPL